MIAQKLVFVYSSQMVLYALQMLCGILVARIAGPSVIGIVAFGMSYVAVFSIIANMGLGIAHVRLVSGGEDLGKCVKTYRVIKTCYAFVFLLVVLSFLFIQKHAFGVQFKSPAQQYVILICLAAIFIQETVLAVPRDTFFAKGEIIKMLIPLITAAVVLQFSRVFVVLLGHGAIALSGAGLVSTLVSIPVSLYLFKGYSSRTRFDSVLARKYLAFSIPAFAMLLGQMVIFSADKVILGYVTNPAQVGYYAAASGITLFILFIGSSMGSVFFPTFSKYISEHKYAEVNSIIAKFEKFNFGFTAPAVFFLAIYSDTVIRFFLGKAYYPSIGILSILSISTFIYIVAQPYVNILGGKGLFGLCATIYLTVVFAFFGFAFIFSWPICLNLRGVGMAFAVCLANSLLCALSIAACGRKMPQLKCLPDFRILIFSVTYAVLMYYIYNVIKIRGVYLRLLFPVLYFAIFYSLLLSTRLMRADDFKQLYRNLKVKKMTHYLSEELALGISDKVKG